MEVHLTTEVETRLNELAAETGRPRDEFVQDAMEAYLAELADLRKMLDKRYEDFKSGAVIPVDGEEVYQELRLLSAARRNNDR